MATTAYMLLLVLVLAVVGTTGVEGQSQSWCVVRSNVSERQLQTALDYACSAGADCAPIQPSALCYLPNTVQSHASYAFNSYYQQRSRATGSCDFAGSATIATTDPSYGSCVFPSSPSSAGGGPNTPPGIPAPPTSGNVPSGQVPPPPGIPGLTPGISPGTPGPDGSESPARLLTYIVFYCLFMSYILLF